MTAPRRSFKSIAINSALTALALGLLAWTVWKNRAQLKEVWARSPDSRLFAAALAIYVTALLVTFYRWYRLVKALDLPFRLRDAVRLGFIGNFFNLVIPGAVGGDVIKAAFLCREQERKTQAVASMVIDRALGLLGLFVLASVVGAFVWAGASRDLRLVIAFAWSMVVCGAIGLAILFSPALFRPLLARLPADGKLATTLAELVAMASAYRAKLGVIALGLALATMGHALYVLAFYLADRGLFGNLAPGPVSHFVVVPLILFTTAVPIPFGALGLTEQFSEKVFRDVLGFSGGAVAMLGYRVVMYAAGLVSVIVYLANLSQVRSLRQVEPNRVDELR
jgi:glycosyltransferase 2 family protein